MKNPRDYKAEYARRIAKGLAQGLSRRQARGHPGAKERTASGKVRRDIELTELRRIERGVRRMRAGSSLAKAARNAHVSSERLRHYVARHRLAVRERGRWKFRKDKRDRQMFMYTEGKVQIVRIKVAEASAIGEYLHAVRRFLERNDPSPLKPFEHRYVTDTTGRKRPFEVRPNVLYQIAAVSAIGAEHIYRIEG